MKNRLLVILNAIFILSFSVPIQSYAGEWKDDNKGYWYVEDDGSYPMNTWKEIEGKHYYFGADGFMLSNTTTPDGYKVGADGAWTENTVQSFNKADDIVKVGNRIIFVDHYEFEKGCYTTWGLVSMNLDGSDKKLILPDNNGENNVSEERLIAIDDYVYFAYNYINLARIKSDGSGFEVLYTANDHSSLNLDSVVGNELLFSPGHGYEYINLTDRSIYQIDRYPYNGRYLKTDNKRYSVDLKEGTVTVRNLNNEVEKNIPIKGCPTGDIRGGDIIGIVDEKLIISYDNYGSSDFLNSTITPYVIALDMNTGNYKVVITNANTIEYSTSDHWIYYVENGLNRVNVAGTVEKITTAEKGGGLKGVYEGYVYYSGGISEGFRTNIYKE